MNDDIELRLRAAFRGPLPAAPVTLEDGLDRVTQEPVVGRRRGTSPWMVLGVAALLVTGVAFGLTVGSRNERIADSPAPSAETPAASASEAAALELVFEAQPIDGSQPDDGVMDELVAIIRGRLELVGVADVTVERVGGPRVVVRIPPWVDAEEVRPLVTQVGRVDVVPLGQEILGRGTTIDPAEYPTLLGRAAIDTATTGQDGNGAPTLILRLTEEAAPLFAAFTADHVGEYFALVLDQEILVVPSLNEAITGGELEINSGAVDGFDPDELRRLAAMINVGGPLGTFSDGELQPIPFVEVSPGPSPAP